MMSKRISPPIINCAGMESDPSYRFCSATVVYCWPTIMADIEKLLNRWTSAGVLAPAAAARILAWEAEQKNGAGLPDEEGRRTTAAAGLAWQGVVALILGGILLATGVILFVSAHWDDIGPGARFALVIAMVAVFHLGGALVRDKYHADVDDPARGGHHLHRGGDCAGGADLQY